MIQIKTEKEIELLREGGRRLAEVVAAVSAQVRPGVTTAELDEIAYGMIKDFGDEPAFLGYRPEGHSVAFPATLCTSVNEGVVHGIPDDVPLREGEIITIDCGIRHAGLFTDHAVTVPVGKVAEDVQQLLSVTEKSLELAIAVALAGNHVGDIGFAVESFVSGRYGIVRELAGHGVGREIHEDPYIPNYGRPGKGELLVPGMVIAIEPMLVMGKPAIDVADDDYTIVTRDGSWAAHYEHTVAITESGVEILTRTR